MRTSGKLLVFGLLGFFGIWGTGIAADKGNFSTAPRTNNGQAWRIGYYEGGPYIDYQKSLVATVQGLMELGWIDQTKLPNRDDEETTALWEWLAAEGKSEYIRFVKNAHYTADWDDRKRNKTANEIVDRLNRKKDIDLMIAMGTWAGKDLANNKHQTPTIVMSTSDPLGAGIIKSIDDSGFDHVHARVDPYRHERQVRIFHEMIGFQKLGIAYEDTVEGRVYARVDKVEKVAREKGFQIERCYTQSDISDKRTAEKSAIGCFTNLSQKVDAVYVTVQGGVNSNSINKLAEIFNSRNIPAFSQSGSTEVKQGLLASMSSASFKFVGKFYATTIARVFNGGEPRKLNQVFEAPPKIAINLQTAKMIKYDPPIDVLLAADEIYQEIEKVEN